MIRLDQFARVAVVGTSCSGKTTLARTLSERLSVPQIELDLLYWGPNWTPNPASDFRVAVDRATVQPRWICDGNYSAVRDLVWQRASAIVWLNYSFPLVFSRALRRTLGRCIRRSPVFAGNRESFRLSFFSRDSILLWVSRTHWRHQRQFPLLFVEPQHAHLGIVELRGTSDLDRFMLDVAQVSSKQNATR